MAWYAKYESVDASPNSTGDKWFIADSFGFGVERDMVVSKTFDMATTPLFDHHTGGANFAFCDGSVRTVSGDPGGEADMGLLLPAVQDLLLPAVQYDFDIA